MRLSIFLYLGNCVFLIVAVNEQCIDDIWCNIPMPSSSHFNFDPPVDLARWTNAQYLASTGNQVLLERISRIFTQPFDFLDGDRSFRSLHHIIDIFVDESTWLYPLTSRKNKIRQSDANAIPIETTDWKNSHRAPILSIGYNKFQKEANTFFTGKYIGGRYVQKMDFLKNWRKVKDIIDYPFIAICSLNENWGWFSSHFPNRTAAWGSCCYKPKDKLTYEFLDHPQTLMMVINQHSNISHPKILTLPRGLPLTWDRTEQLVWDSIRQNLRNSKKEVLLFAAASSWGKRPQILQCVSQRFAVEDFEGHVSAVTSKDRLDRLQYYTKLSTARFGLCLPGLGYDTFRLWEFLTMGSIAVIERGVGFDRTLYKLPALLVDDFADITPELLRSAYVEAMYRADEFEFHRLTQSFWWSVIFNVSSSRSLQPMLDLFPMSAEDTSFTRPRIPFECATSQSCGEGTKRTPQQSC